MGGEISNKTIFSWDLGTYMIRFLTQWRDDLANLNLSLDKDPLQLTTYWFLCPHQLSEPASLTISVKVSMLQLKTNLENRVFFYQIVELLGWNFIIKSIVWYDPCMESFWVTKGSSKPLCLMTQPKYFNGYWGNDFVKIMVYENKFKCLRKYLCPLQATKNGISG